MRKTHGMYGTKIYKVWLGAKNRCYNKNIKRFKDYGGRGISMQENWISNFQSFYDYVSNLPNYNENNLGRKGMTLDRIENNGNYEENNLRWTTSSIQQRNKRKPKSNTSGFIGVSFCTSKSIFRAYIKISGAKVNLGSHKVAAEAYKFRKAYIIANELEGFEVDLLTGELKN